MTKRAGGEFLQLLAKPLTDITEDFQKRETSELIRPSEGRPL